MKPHGNARSRPKSRRLLVERIERREYSLGQAALAAGVSERTAYRWLARWRRHASQALDD
jgi:transposase